MIKDLKYFMYQERLGVGTFQHGEETFQGDLINVHKYLIGTVKKMEPGFSQCCPVTGQEAVGTDLKFFLNIQEKVVVFFLM